MVKDAAFASTLRRHIEDGIAAGVLIQMEDFIHIPWYKRVWYGFTYLVYRGVMRIVTLGSYS